MITVEPCRRIPATAGQFVHAGVRGRQGLTRDAVMMTAKQQFSLMGAPWGRRQDDPDHRLGHAAAGPIGRPGQWCVRRGGEERGRTVGLAGR